MQDTVRRRSVFARVAPAAIPMLLVAAAQTTLGLVLVGGGLWNLVMLDEPVAWLALVAGVVVLGSLVPRSGPRPPAGVPVADEHHPRLVALVREVAARLGTRPPDRIELTFEANARAELVGGVLGFGGERVLQLGLGLMRLENLSQLRATLAHELAHFAHDDARAERLEEAIARQLDQMQWAVRLLPGMTAWRRRTVEWRRASSREAELAADACASEVAGVSANIEGLKMQHRLSLSMGAFLEESVAPLIQIRVAPTNLFKGFDRYWPRYELPDLESLFAVGSDTHPSVSERADFARGLPFGDQPIDTSPALALLDGPVAELEEAVTRAFVADDALERIEWEKVGAVWATAERWRAIRAQARISTLTVGQALDALENAETQRQFVETVAPALRGYSVADGAVAAELKALIRSYLGAFLARKGFEWTLSPAEGLSLERGDQLIRLEALISDVLERQAPLEKLRQAIAAAGVESSESLPITESERYVSLKPQAELTFVHGPEFTEVSAPLEHVVFPGRCAVCCGAAVAWERTSFPVGWVPRSVRWVRFTLATCEAHRSEFERALRVTAWRRSRDTDERVVVFEVRRAYAELLKSVNA